MYYGKELLTKKQFDKRKNKKTIIVGCTNLKEYNEKKHEEFECVQYDGKQYIVKPEMHGFTKRYIRVSQNEYIAVKMIGVLFIFLLIGITSLMISLTIGIASGKDYNINIPFYDDSEKESESENSNAIDLDDIPGDTEEVDLTQDMAYVSGNSLTTVKKSYQNVYLQNDKRNENFLLVYEAYINGSTKCAYRSGKIPAGRAEPWNAYMCDEIKDGENDVVYEVYVYDKEGTQVAQTTLTGLTIIKK